MKKLLIFAIIIMFASVSFAQDEDWRKLSDKIKFNTAEMHVDEEDYHLALDIFYYLSEKAPDNANLNFKIGFCYLKTAHEKEKSVKYLEKAIKDITGDYNPDSYGETKAPTEAYYMLGKAYHSTYKFDKAIQAYNKFLEILPAKDTELYKGISRDIEVSQNGAELIKKPLDIVVTNLGNGINSAFSDHSPVFSADEEVLIFTSKRKANEDADMSDDGQYFEDIYISHKKDGIWGQPENIGQNINTKRHEASIGLSVDGQQLFIYKDDGGEDGNIYLSKLHGDTWSVPEKMGSNINTKYKESHASLSADGDKLYFTSNRKGGYGGMDIYMVKKLPNGDWSLAQNMGPTVNTEYDEEGPYIHPDGVTLFFSSLGHKSMGGYDIFFTNLDEEKNTWSEPTNVGYPINTTNHDIFYIPTVDGRRAYYASNQTGGMGKSDVYLLNVPGAGVKPLTVLTGSLVLGNGKAPENAFITITDIDSDEIIGTYTPNSKTGKFLFILPPGSEYNVFYEAEDHFYLSEILTVEESSSYKEIQRAVKLRPIVIDGENETKEIVFERGSAYLDNVASAELHNLASFLKQNRRFTFNIEKDNLPIYKDRYNAIMQDLLINGVSSDQELTAANDKGFNIVIKIVEKGALIVEEKPKAIIEKVQYKEITIQNIFFDFDKDQTDKYYKNLDNLAQYLITNPDAIVEIHGHTDSQGENVYNVDLSVRRATFAKKYLSKKGVPDKCIVPKGFGESKPISVDLNPDTRKYNRRVEFNVVKQGKDQLKIELISVPEKYKLK